MKNHVVYIVAESAETAAEYAEKIVRHNEDWTAINPWVIKNDNIKDDLANRSYWLTSSATAFLPCGQGDVRDLEDLEIDIANYLGLEEIDPKSLLDAHEEKERLNCE